MKKILMILSFSCIILTVVKTQTNTDSIQIIETIYNYGLGWYEGKTDSMEKALYYDFGKRQISLDENGKTKISENTAMSMYQKTRARSEKPLQHDEALKKIKEVGIYDIHDNIACGYIKSEGWIDYILLAKIDGQWKMMNVIWQKPKKQE